MCSKSSRHSDGTADVCLLKDLTSGVWVNETLLIIYETNKTMKKISWGSILQCKCMVEVIKIGA